MRLAQRVRRECAVYTQRETKMENFEVDEGTPLLLPSRRKNTMRTPLILSVCCKSFPKSFPACVSSTLYPACSTPRIMELNKSLCFVLALARSKFLFVAAVHVLCMPRSGGRGCHPAVAPLAREPDGEFRRRRGSTSSIQRVGACAWPPDCRRPLEENPGMALPPSLLSLSPHCTTYPHCGSSNP